jgi:hypothetical protein
MGGTGRSTMLSTGVYTVSHPGGVWKPVAPRSEIPPGGVPRSSGTKNTRAIVPIGSEMFSEKICCHLSPSILRK